MKTKLFQWFVLTLTVVVFSSTSAYAVSDYEAKIHSALEDESRMEFIETPLGDVARFLSDQHDIPIYIDAQVLKEENIDPDVPVTLNLRGIPLRSSLSLLTRSVGISWTIKDNVLMLTTHSVAMINRMPRVYDTRWLASGDSKIEDVAKMVQISCQRQSPTAGEIDVLGFRNTLVVTATVEGHEIVAGLLHTLKEADIATANRKPIGPNVRPRPRSAPAPSTADPANADPATGDPFGPPPRKPARLAPKSDPNDPFSSKGRSPFGESRESAGQPDPFKG